METKIKAIVQEVQEHLPKASEDAAPENEIVVVDCEEETLINSLAHAGGRLTVGAITGFCTGLAARRVGRTAAVYLGAGFAVMQYLAYKGYITIHWGKAKEIARDAVDVNGDGEIDAQDAKIVVKKVLEVLRYQLPSASGFVGGLAFGLKQRV
eukprot:JZ551039.1.p1 GENE.JZ551039.1~~JZ551039.1.p1  ORF type:complete len:153 (+),score=30.66 JZ551039.1:1-459(+)